MNITAGARASEAYARSIFIRRMLNLACKILKCSLSLS